ncbi:SAM-dependent methyltransferase [Actinomadura sp. 3N508]|uniref:SAM-dependent methyltransferase n=1 Tax=Actinomadura sp. 3N508 TaxID=3375153 RepID=UPI00378C952A
MTDTEHTYTKPRPALMYNFYLRGKSWSGIDAQAAIEVIRAAPDAPAVAQANLKFAGRAAAWAVAEFGLGQVLDVGVGIVHDVPLDGVETCVRAVAPNATVLAYDNDPVVLTHARAWAHYGGVLRGDITDLDSIFNHPDAVGLIDPSEPTLVVAAAVLHFVRDPAAVMAGLRERLAPGSVVVVSHATSTGTEQGAVDDMTEAYDTASSSINFRPEEEIRALADGWAIVTPPGLVPVETWSVDGSRPYAPYESVRVLGMAAVLPGGPAPHLGGDRAAL